jgi:hypothetical protein
MLPKNRRDFGSLILGFAAALGVTAIPGLTVEPEELTRCRIEIAVVKANLKACSLDVEDKKGRLDRCWSRRRNSGDAPEEPE